MLATSRCGRSARVLARCTISVNASFIRYLSTASSQEFQIKRTLNIPKTVMYDTVGDVQRYQYFVPYCLGSEVLKTENNVPSWATLRIGWDRLDEKFDSKLEYTKDTVTAVAANNKIFKELYCKWTIIEVNATRCTAMLQLRFLFQNPLYNLLTQKFGQSIAKKMIEAFSTRSYELYKRELNRPLRVR